MLSIPKRLHELRGLNPPAMHSLECIVWLHILQIPQLPRFVHEVVLTPRSSRNGHSPQEIGRLITRAGVAKAKLGLSESLPQVFPGRGIHRHRRTFRSHRRWRRSQPTRKQSFPRNPDSRFHIPHRFCSCYPDQCRACYIERVHNDVYDANDMV